MATTTSTITGDIPEVLEPYYTTGAAGQPGLIEQAFRYYGKPYEEAYGKLATSGLAGKGRVAELSPFQEEVGTELSRMGTPTQFGAATGYGQTAADIFSSMSGIQAPTVGIGSITNKDVLGSYMSPYQRSVIDQQKAAAIRDAQKANLSRNLMSAKQGTYGGARQLLATTEAERALLSQMSNIEAQGLQNAYNAALAQFNVENQLGLTAQQANQQAALQAAQQRQGLGTAMQSADLQRLAAQEAAGKSQQDQQQQELNTAYNQFLEQRDYEKNQLGFLSGLIRGVPFSTTQTGTTTAPAPSTTSQLAGLGVAGIGLANLLK